MMKRARGFTLIELIIVVAMISILLSIAVPSFRSFMSNYRVTTAVNDFLQGVTVARGEAIKRGRRVVMVPNDATTGLPNPVGSWANGWTIFVDTTSPPNFTLSTTEIAAGNLIFSHGKLPTTVSITDAGGGTTLTSNGSTYISFDGTGYARQVTTSSIIMGGVKITDSMVSNPIVRVLCVGPLGRPRIVTNNASYDCSSG